LIGRASNTKNPVTLNVENTTDNLRKDKNVIQLSFLPA